MEIDPNIPSDEYIFDRRFKCLVPQLDTTSKEYLKLFGMPTVGDRGIDREMANQLITTYKTISEMALLFRDGVIVRIPNMQDCETIYKYVEYHLSRWANTVSNSVNKGIMPVDDLVTLDQFASAIYPHATSNPKKLVSSNTFEQHLDNGFMNIDKLFGKQKEETKESDVQIEQRESYANVFINKTRWR